MNIECFLIAFIAALLVSTMSIICVELVELIDKIARKLRRPIEFGPYENWMPDMVNSFSKGQIENMKKTSMLVRKINRKEETNV